MRIGWNEVIPVRVDGCVGRKRGHHGEMYATWCIFSGMGEPMGREKINDGECTVCRCGWSFDNVR